MLQFNHQHYVPILKSKPAEAWALAKLSSEAGERITPLVELLPPREHPLDVVYLRETCARFHEARLAAPIFLDSFYLGTEKAVDAKHVTHIFAEARRRGMWAVPTTSLGRSEKFQVAVRDVVDEDRHGALLRLSSIDFLHTDRLRAALDGLLSFLNLEPNLTHLLIDYHRIADSALLPQLLRMHIPQLPHLRHWRTITAAAGCFPSSLLAVLDKKHEWAAMRREEWHGWLAAIHGKPELLRRPAFGDYGVRDPGLPAEGGRAAANLRYTANGNFLVCRGDQVSKGGASQMHSMCESLTKRSEFAGKKFSAGDAEIAATATTRNSGGNPAQWVQWCMNHHLHAVARDVARAS